MQDTIYLSPESPTFEKEFAESASFRKINKILPRRTQSYEQMNEKQLNRLFCNNAGHHLIFIATTHFAPNSPTFEKEFAESAFFRKINKILLRRTQSYEQMNEKQLNRLFCNNAGHHLILSPPPIFPPTVLPSRKNSLSQHFFEKLIRYYQEEHNLISE